MKVRPGATVHVSSSEGAILELDSDIAVTAARLVPRVADPVEIDLDAGKLAWPDIPAPDVVYVKWLADASDEHAACTARVVVASRHYFELSQLKSYGDGRDDFGSRPDEELAAARQAATEVFEEAASRAFVPRIGSTKDYGRGDLLALKHHDVRELLTDGYEQASGSQLSRLPGCGPFPMLVEYEYGLDDVPAEVSRAVLDLAAYTLRPSNRPIGATGESTDAGYIHFTTAGRDGATAIPEVNAAIELFGAGKRYVW